MKIKFQKRMKEKCINVQFIIKCDKKNTEVIFEWQTAGNGFN
jgi:hypothetical protein